MSPQKHTELREDLSFPILMTGPCQPFHTILLPVFPVTCTLFLLPESSFLPQQLYSIPYSSMSIKSGHLAATQIVVHTATITNSDFLLIPSAKVGTVTRDFLTPFGHSPCYVSLKEVCVLP